MQLKPTKLSYDQLRKIAAVVVYVAISSAIAGVLSWVTDNKELFGVYYAPVNLLLVTLKQVFTKPT